MIFADSLHRKAGVMSSSVEVTDRAGVGYYRWVVRVQTVLDGPHREVRSSTDGYISARLAFRAGSRALKRYLKRRYNCCDCR